jgi:uncharacterized protein (TIGR02588 family)
MMAPKARSRTARRTYPDDIPPLEWLTAGLGVALLIAFLTLLLHSALAGPKGPPDVDVRVLEIHAQKGRYLVVFQARNRGGTTASALAIEGELRKGGATLEVRRAELDELPSGSERNGGMFFTHDPQASQLRLTPVSFREP